MSELEKAFQAHGEGFKAEYEGQGFWSLRKDGWPDYVTMGNGGDVYAGEYRSRDYIRKDLVDATVADRDALICDMFRIIKFMCGENKPPKPFVDCMEQMGIEVGA
ncbi:MAG: hypothetical protein IJ781_04520 [Atopobiaceae bacterium]|nr:hypothetical protein [Atopobiaceae bacterium]